MATTDIYHIVGSTKGRKATAFLGGNVDDAIQIDAFAAARVAANDTKGTFTAWINVPDITGTYAIVGCGDASAVEYFWLGIEAGKLIAYANIAANVAWDINSTSVVITPHKWHHVAFVHDTHRISMYIDGVKVAMSDTDITEASYWFDTFANIDSASIGATDSEAGGAALTNEFKGAISDLKYFNTNLTLSEIQKDYEGAAQTTTITANMTDHWDFDNDYVNSVTPGNNGTKVGDVVLTNNYSEFTSRLRNSPAAAAVVADKLVFSVDHETGHAILIKAA